MPEISDEWMQARLAKVRPYVMVLLRKGPAYQSPERREPEQARTVREHGRRNMRLQAEGKMALVGPVHGAGDLVGLCLFAVPQAEARALMDQDMAVRAGIFVYDVATWYGVPGDTLPA
ncbi:MAG TPA: YciI family protein [Devosia sp.]|nr:YciI family protein [Devosia sp.]